MGSCKNLCRSRLLEVLTCNYMPVRTKRYGWIEHKPGLPPYKARSLEQKLRDANYKDPAIHYKVNIGLPQIVYNRNELRQERLTHFKNLKNDPELEKKSREHKLFLDLEEVSREWLQESAAEHIKAAAEHYGVFQDLFGDAFFYPLVNLDVAFKLEDSLLPVYRGNCIKPSQALTQPEITYDAEPTSLWTLALTNPDGNLEEENSECLHWLIGNIPGNKVGQGEVVAEYLQPFPSRGTGFQRFIFILYKQTEKIDYSALKIPPVKIDLKSRKFNTYDFYRARQENLTPAGLAFCQVDWDPSVSQFFHTVLDVDEPVYEYDFAPPYHTKQRLYPIKQPFNLYMDRYRDPKQIAKEYLLKKFKNRHPFAAPKPPLRFPNAVVLKHDLNEKLHGRTPSWLKREKLKDRLGYGRVNDY